MKVPLFFPLGLNNAGMSLSEFQSGIRTPRRRCQAQDNALQSCGSPTTYSPNHKSREIRGGDFTLKTSRSVKQARHYGTNMLSHLTGDGRNRQIYRHRKETGGWKKSMGSYDLRGVGFQYGKEGG